MSYCESRQGITETGEKADCQWGTSKLPNGDVCTNNPQTSVKARTVAWDPKLATELKGELRTVKKISCAFLAQRQQKLKGKVMLINLFSSLLSQIFILRLRIYTIAICWF